MSSIYAFRLFTTVPVVLFLVANCYNLFVVLATICTDDSGGPWVGWLLAYWQSGITLIAFAGALLLSVPIDVWRWQQRKKQPGFDPDISPVSRQWVQRVMLFSVPTLVLYFELAKKWSWTPGGS